MELKSDRIGDITYCVVYIRWKSGKLVSSE